MSLESNASIHQMDKPVTRAIFVVSSAAFVLFGLLGTVTADIDLLVSSWPALGVAVLAAFQIFLGRENVPVIAVFVAISLAASLATIPIDSPRAPSVIGLAATGTTVSLYVTRRIMVFIVGYSTFLVAVVALTASFSATSFVTGLSTAVVFGFTTYLLRTMQLRADEEREQYRVLFNHSPIAMWEEDFTAVRKQLTSLRSQGVDDLAGYLERNPHEKLRLGAKIKVTAVNEAATHLFEADSPTHLIGGLSLRRENAVSALTQQLVAVWEGVDHVVSDAEQARTFRGKEMYLTLTWSVPVLDGKPDLSRVAVAAVDMTESRKTRHALEALVRSKDELVATVSHELRTPLTTVVGLAELLSASINDYSDEEVHDLVELIASEGREVSTIVEDLLAAAQTASGMLRLRLATVDLVALLKDVHRSLPYGKPFELIAASRPVLALADPVRVRQILRNLIVNACKYGGTDIRVMVVPTGRTVAVEVRDSGNPLPFAEREAIFDRYYRSRQVPGLTASVGLGLTVSRQLARGMAGDITYSHDGEEAIFELTLPPAAPSAQTAPQQTTAVGDVLVSPPAL